MLKKSNEKEMDYKYHPIFSFASFVDLPFFPSLFLFPFSFTTNFQSL